jgi:hypothetical protein
MLLRIAFSVEVSKVIPIFDQVCWVQPSKKFPLLRQGRLKLQRFWSIFFVFIPIDFASCSFAFILCIVAMFS